MKKDFKYYSDLIESREGLPTGFNEWGLANNDGWTVAHKAACYDLLPSNFTQWELADNDGWTVAHSAACYNRLPPNFTLWDLEDNSGKTVKEVYLENLK